MPCNIHIGPLGHDLHFSLSILATDLAEGAGMIRYPAIPGDDEKRWTGPRWNSTRKAHGWDEGMSPVSVLKTTHKYAREQLATSFQSS